MLKELIQPNSIVINEKDKNICEFIFEPLERGYGFTIGQALQNILLKCLRGSALTNVALAVNAVPISPEASQQNTMPILEAPEEFLANFRALSFVADTCGEFSVVLEGTQRKIYAKEIYELSGTVGYNHDTLICHYTGPEKLSVQMRIDSCTGYRSKSDNALDGYFSFNSFFSPVILAEYRVEDTRVRDKTDFNRLIMMIKTSPGSSPVDVLRASAEIFQHALAPMVDLPMQSGDTVTPGDAIDIFCFSKVNTLQLSSRSINCLHKENIFFVGDLIQKTKKDLMATPNFGKKSLQEIEACLQEYGYALGTIIEGWEEAKKKSR